MERRVPGILCYGSLGSFNLRAARRCAAAVLVALLIAGPAAADVAPIPKDSIRLLGSTKGKAFSSGFVFVDGRFVPSPYKVMRRGCGISVGEAVAISEVVPWDRFCAKSGGADPVTERVVTVKTNYVVEAVSEEEKVARSEAERALDEVFGHDESSSASEPSRRMVLQSNVTVRVVKPAVPPTLTYQPGNASKRNVQTINNLRLRIDRHLRGGGVVFFGSDYSPIFVDAAVADSFLDRLSTAMKNADSPAALSAALRAADVVYLPEKAIRDVYEHRTGYLKVREARDAARLERQVRALLK